WVSWRMELHNFATKGVVKVIPLQILSADGGALLNLCLINFNVANAAIHLVRMEEGVAESGYGKRCWMLETSFNSSCFTSHWLP
ncbi:MAG: hypothetical protein K6T90_20475, partial [Leptolyngbyaceae cyanobacterium HOT.MB2.61]|nr:hypothetical protein [Leptolyngbyaceae cyanobacterium HOT.MB2.61]